MRILDQNDSIFCFKLRQWIRNSRFLISLLWNCHNKACNSGKSLRHGNRFTVAWVILSSDHLIFQLKSKWGSCINPKICSKIPLQLSFWWAVPQTPMMTIPCGSFLPKSHFKKRPSLIRNPGHPNSTIPISVSMQFRKVPMPTSHPIRANRDSLGKSRGNFFSQVLFRLYSWNQKRFFTEKEEIEKQTHTGLGGCGRFLSLYSLFSTLVDDDAVDSDPSPTHCVCVCCVSANCVRVSYSACVCHPVHPHYIQHHSHPSLLYPMYDRLGGKYNVLWPFPLSKGKVSWRQLPNARDILTGNTSR